jgi:nitrogenase molybdenum-iron protein NifN
MFDRLGAGHQLSVGYRGTRDLIFDIANLIIADHEDNHQATPDTWRTEGQAPGVVDAATMH